VVRESVGTIATGSASVNHRRPRAHRHHRPALCLDPSRGAKVE